jgi:hypothetical protein
MQRLKTNVIISQGLDWKEVVMRTDGFLALFGTLRHPQNRELQEEFSADLK